MVEFLHACILVGAVVHEQKSLSLPPELTKSNKYFSKAHCSWIIKMYDNASEYTAFYVLSYYFMKCYCR
jgi:hypothetical protein